jgi:SAM-dependent methyltransferase
MRGGRGDAGRDEGLMPTCEICGGQEFGPGPNGRMAPNGSSPACVKCGSLERHRIGRRILRLLNADGAFVTYRALQFSDDPVLEWRWFAAVERSMYQGPNSIDVQDIARADGSYDFIMCSHVVEHVPDHRRAIRELARILNATGLMLLAYPNPVTRAVTEDWGYPDPAKHDHYRVLGRDFESEYWALLPDCHVIAVMGVDDVTQAPDRIYLVTKSSDWVQRIASAGLSIETISAPSA